MLSLIGGSSKPGLVAAEPRGPATAAKISRMIASAAATGSTPRFQRDEKGHHEVEDDVGDLHAFAPSSASHPPMVMTS